jgi:hypothetical protein
MEWVKDSLGLQSPLSRAQSYSWEQSQIQADPVFGPYDILSINKMNSVIAVHLLSGAREKQFAAHLRFRFAKP